MIGDSDFFSVIVILKISNFTFMEPNSILENHLRANSSFNSEEIAIISSFFHSKILKKEEVLFEKGRRFAEIVFVTDGILCSYTHDAEGEEVIKTFISPMTYFAEIESFENKTPCSFHVKAITPSKLLTLSKTDSEILARQIPNWEIDMKNETVKAMNAMIRKQEFLSIGEAADKYRIFIKNFPELAREVPLKYIASYLQITQSSLSRIRRQGW